MALHRLAPNVLACLFAFSSSVALSQVPTTAAVDAPVPVLADTVYDRTAVAMSWADWEEMERLYAEARTDMRRAAEGGLAVCLFGNGVVRGYAGESQAYHETRVAATLAWARTRPDSPLAHAVHLQSLVNQAWFFRGGGFAKTVSDQRFADFKAKLNEALAYMQAHAAVLERDNYYIRPFAGADTWHGR